MARFEYRLNGGGKRVWAGYLEDLRLYNPFSSTHRIDYVRQMYGISGDFVSPHSRLWHDPDSATFAMALRENDVAKVHKMTGIVGRPWQYWGGTILAGAIVTEMIVLGILLFPVLLPISVLMTWCEWAWKTYWGR